MIKPTLTPRRACLLWALATISLTAACGSDDEPTMEEIASMSEEEAAEIAREIKDLSGVKACELLTAADIEAGTGIAPGPPEEGPQFSLPTPACNWPAADGTRPNLVILLVTQSGESSYEDFVESSRSRMEDSGMEFNEEDWQHVPDVGDFGVWVGEEMGGVLQVYDDGLKVLVDAEPAEGRDELEASKELARKAFERL